MPSLREITYDDLDLNLTPHPLTKAIQHKRNADAVKQAIRNLVLTDLGERPFHPDIGSDVRRSLFDNFGPMTASIIRSNVRRVINAYEPRAEIVDVVVSVNEDYNGYNIKVIFRVVNLSTPVDVDIFLKRTR